MSLILILGNKNYSSWSLRPWMVMKEFDISFEERVVPLHRDESKAVLFGNSPAGKAPSLLHDGFAVWDSLAIIEYLADSFPDRAIWPKDPQARARARSLSCEMHSGFLSLRKDCPMNFRRVPKAIAPSDKLLSDVARIEQAWGDARALYGTGGPFLFGAFSAADAMFAPIVNRIEAYALPISPQTQAYMDAIASLPSWREWTVAAKSESWVIEQFEI
jgi:glutathione S-transferase